MQLSDEVRQFILQYISSVDQLDILLLLKHDPAREWSADEVARTLSTGSDAVASRMAGLASDGLIQRSPKDETRYKYGPRSPDLDRTMTQLAADSTRTTPKGNAHEAAPQTHRSGLLVR